MKLVDFIQPTAVTATLEAKDKPGALAALGRLLATTEPELGAARCTEILTEREQLATTGVGDAKLFKAFISCVTTISRNSVTSWTLFPESRSTQTTYIRDPSSSAVVIHICLPRTTGEDHPRPWMAVFQATFSVSLQLVGGSAPSACPWPPGPRNCGQSADAVVQETTTIRKTLISVLIMRFSMREGYRGKHNEYIMFASALPVADGGDQGGGKKAGGLSSYKN